MKVEEFQITGVKLLHPDIYADERGSFMEIFREEQLGVPFVQANHSRSRQGVLRGLHYHRRQSDAWYVIRGTARAGLADLRARVDRPPVLTVDLSSDEPAVLLLPPGVAHGFYAVTEVDLIYWVTHTYDDSDEHGVPWDDPALDVPWGATDPMLSTRDREVPALDWDEVERRLGSS